VWGESLFLVAGNIAIAALIAIYSLKSTVAAVLIVIVAVAMQLTTIFADIPLAYVEIMFKGQIALVVSSKLPQVCVRWR
jgi:hypothetical protein